MSVTSPINSISSSYLVARMAWNVFKVKSAVDNPKTPKGAYRPWKLEDSSDDEALIEARPNISGKVQIAASNTSSLDAESQEKTIALFFDAFLRENHSSTIRITDHPVQGRGYISDHAYKMPDRITIDIMVSDAMDAVVANQFTDCETKSISAYKALKRLQEARTLLSVRTKYGMYDNMLIESLTSPVDYKTKNTLKCTAVLRQVLIAEVSRETVSAIPHANTETNLGTVPVKANRFDSTTFARGTEKLFKISLSEGN